MCWFFLEFKNVLKSFNLNQIVFEIFKFFFNFLADGHLEQIRCKKDKQVWCIWFESICSTLNHLSSGKYVSKLVKHWLLFYNRNRCKKVISFGFEFEQFDSTQYLKLSH